MAALETGLPFTAHALLAPMEGITESCFRELVADRNGPEVLGGTFTEFVRVGQEPLGRRALRVHLHGTRDGRDAGKEPSRVPVGLQLMGPVGDALAETARRAEEIGAPLIDLNFGCPAKGALRACAGAALLDQPERLEELVRACVQAVQSVPVTAKVRSGGEDDSRLEEIALAVEAGGARMLTVHCRTRREGYSGQGDWDRLRRVVGVVSIPVCGNGGVESHADLERLRCETGCAHVMVGRAVLADPWIFSGRQVGRGEAARFLLDYIRRLGAHRGGSSAGVFGRVKQLIHHWRAGALFGQDRRRWLSEPDLACLIGLLEDQQARAPIGEEVCATHPSPDGHGTVLHG